MRVSSVIPGSRWDTVVGPVGVPLGSRWDAVVNAVFCPCQAPAQTFTSLGVRPLHQKASLSAHGAIIYKIDKREGWGAAASIVGKPPF